MYFQTGQVIFVPEWPKGEFVRFWLATFWLTKSLVCIDAFIRDSTIQSDVRRFCTAYKSEDFGSLSAVRMTCHPVRTPICPLFHPSGRCAILSRNLDKPIIIRPNDVDFCPNPSLYREVSVPACIHPDVSAARPNASQYSIKLQILSKFIYGKIDTTVRTTWIPVRTCFSLNQESQLKFNSPNSSLPSSRRACI
jgi:hypothetical protein